MNTNFIYSTSYNDALKKTIAQINSRKVDLNVRHLLIVPERYTLLAEKMLYRDSAGSFDVEVLSLSRLFYRLQISTPLLSREGAIMLIRGMLPSLELKCFYRSASHRGFCEKAYDAINDFAASGVAPEDVPETSPKLSDLKAIYAEYTKRISGRFVDSMGKLTLIAREAETSNYLDNVHIYVANFDYVDNATRRVFDALKRRAISYTECTVGGELAPKKLAEGCNAEGAIAVKEAAKRIRYAAYSGIAYEDIAVIVGNADVARIKRIFREFDIPCFIAESKRLIDYTLAAFLIELFECARSKRRENFINLSKNLYMGIEKQSADEFENYVNGRLIDYKGFYNEFAECDIEVEQTRKRLISIVEPISKKLKSVTDAKSFGQLIEDVFAMVGAEKTSELSYDSIAPVERIRGLIDLMGQVGIRGNFEFISSVFEEGLKASKMSSLPYEGGVVVGDPAAFRGGKYKLIAVIGFDDGFLPQIYDDSSLISDDEKALFTHMERADQINSRYEFELRATLDSAEMLFITYVKPSGMVDELLSGSEIRLADGYAFEAGSKKHAVELMTSLIRRTAKSDGDHLEFINALHKATDASDEIGYLKREEQIEEGNKLFFPYGTTNVSQLQSYFKCPFRHLMDYGLRLTDRDKGEMNPLDIGSFMHSIVEEVVKAGDYSDVAASVNEIVQKLIDGGGKYALDANKKQIEELKAEAIETLKIYTRHLSKGSFKPVGQEIEFKTDISGIKLRGKIDMADEYNGYVRIIDYKTGKADVKFSDVYYGKKLQLPLYMAVARTYGYRAGAMFNFPFSYKWICDKTDHRFSGFMLGDLDIAKAVDCEMESGESEVFGLKLTKTGKLNMQNQYLLTDAEMNSLIEYAVKVSENAVSEISEGYVASSPCAPCGSCEYACLCADKRLRKQASAGKKVIMGGGK